MTTMNKVFLAGNLTRDPELRQTSTGRAVGGAGLAVTESYRNKDGQTVETTCFVDLVFWGKTAETCHQYLAKGSPVLVEGKLELDTWEKEGEQRNRLRVRAERVQFLGKPRNGKPAAGEVETNDNRNGARKPVVKTTRTVVEEEEPINF